MVIPSEAFIFIVVAVVAESSFLYPRVFLLLKNLIISVSISVKN